MMAVLVAGWQLVKQRDAVAPLEEFADGCAGGILLLDGGRLAGLRAQAVLEVLRRGDDAARLIAELELEVAQQP